METSEFNFNFLSDTKRHETRALYYGIENWFDKIYAQETPKNIYLTKRRSYFTRRGLINLLKSLKRDYSDYFDLYICRMINDLFEKYSEVRSLLSGGTIHKLANGETAFWNIVEALSALGFIWDAERNQLLSGVGHFKEEQALTSELEHYLQKLGTPFLDKYIGAWDAFLSTNRDRHRNAITSMRTLYENVFHKLAPKTNFQKPATDITRKDRLRYILHASKTQRKHKLRAIDAFLKFYDEINILHQKGTHEKEGLDRQTTLFALKMSEYALYYILSVYFAK